MHPTRLNVAIAALCIAFVAPAAAPAQAGSLGDADFLIRRGNHYATPHPLLPMALCLSARTDRTLTFRVLFPAATAAYTTQNPANQGDWNKVMGITTLDVHKNSIRLGWRWLPAESRMELGFYGYAKGRRVMVPLAKVATETWTDCELRLHRGGLMARAGAARHEVNESLGFSSFFPTPTWVLKTAYFGGDETAPHDIRVRVQGIVVRP